MKYHHIPPIEEMHLIVVTDEKYFIPRPFSYGTLREEMNKWIKEHRERVVKIENLNDGDSYNYHIYFRDKDTAMLFKLTFA